MEPAMEKTIIKVGMASCGIAAGAQEVYDRLEAYLAENPLPVQLKQTACIGMCFEEPVVELSGMPQGSITLGKVDADNIIPLINEYIQGGTPASHVILAENCDAPRNELLASQQRIVRSNCGVFDPSSLEDFEALGGYEALRKALAMTPEDIISVVKDAGLRGRGGAGFSTGVKWSFARVAPGDKKYVVCNADEGDPGAFMDRSVLEGDPH